MEEITAAYVRRLLPRRDPMGHKGTFGKVLCLCGSVGYTGAPVFASRGAVRSGAGLVFLGVPESIWPVAAVKSDEAMPFPLPEAEGRLSLLAEEFHLNPQYISQLFKSEIGVMFILMSLLCRHGAELSGTERA